MDTYIMYLESPCKLNHYDFSTVASLSLLYFEFSACQEINCSA